MVDTMVNCVEIETSLSQQEASIRVKNAEKNLLAEQST